MATINEIKERHAWLDGLGPGDPVIVESPGYPSRKYIKRVERTTKTQIIVDDIRYRKDTGRKVGGSTSYSGTYRILMPTDELVAEVKRDRVVRFLTNLTADKLDHLDAETLERIAQELRP